MWVKICGNTSLEDARGAAEAGADAAGFIFAPSKRQVTIEQVATITPHLSLEKIGVFVDAAFETIVATVESAGLTGVQLHSAVDSDLATRLRARFGSDFRLLQVIHYQQELTS